MNIKTSVDKDNIFEISYHSEEMKSNQDEGQLLAEYFPYK